MVTATTPPSANGVTHGYAPAVISVGGQPPPRRPTLSIWAAVASMAVLTGGLVILGLSSWYDLEDLRAVNTRLRNTDGVDRLGLWLPAAAGLLIIGILILAVGILTITMRHGSRLASRLSCGLAAASALSCAALPLLGSDDTQAIRHDPNTIVVVINHNPATMPEWATWSEVAGRPVFIVGAVLVTVVLLLPSTRRDLLARRRAPEATAD